MLSPSGLSPSGSAPGARTQRGTATKPQQGTAPAAPSLRTLRTAPSDEVAALDLSPHTLPEMSPPFSRGHGPREAGARFVPRRHSGHRAPHRDPGPAHPGTAGRGARVGRAVRSPGARRRQRGTPSPPPPSPPPVPTVAAPGPAQASGGPSSSGEGRGRR